MSENLPKEGSKDDVKSQAIIKFQSIPEIPFSQLDYDLDLRLPPSNWLNGAIKFSNYKSTFNFSSFKMAFDFYDELFSDEIDVIASSEVIKKLLGIAYNDQSVLSYFVHRVGNTLLIDEFNLHRYLLWKSVEEDDWKWLRKFICEHVLNSLNEKSPIPIEHKKTKEFLERKNLLSKFLYYSIEDAKKVEEKEYEPSYINNYNVVLPQPSIKDMANIGDDNHQYSRTILWDFEDIRMMIGSDMQIFGNELRPCISLRLRDMKEKINVLTGIDYWLDNLMCNVPELFMCYHLDGIVQKYELIKTEELPDLSENSKFSPKVIRNVAQNILSFLKQNATKPGHTYWLFKSRNDDVVKLYDLTTLQLLSEEKESSEGKEEKKNTNPFTYPVGVLLYTLARNMKYSKEKFTAKKAGNIKLLLENCLKLLPIEKYPQIITTSHYILSDIQIPAGMNPIDPQPNFEESESSDETSDELDESEEDEVEESSFPVVKSIKETLNEYRPSNRKSTIGAPLVLGSIQERSCESLKNIVAGLRAIEFLESDDNLGREKQKEKDQIIHEEQNPNLLQNPDIAIAMGWTNSKQNENDADDVSSVSNKSFHNLDTKSLLMKGNPNIKTWNIHLKTLLFEKASLTYACLAEYSYNNKNYGAALKNIRQSIACQAVIKKYIPSIITQQSVLYGRAGDCFFQISKNLNQAQKYINGFNGETELDREILKQLEKENLGEIETEIFSPMEDETKILECSCQCYERSLLDTNQSPIELIRRLGNVYNEIGVKLMHKSQNAYNAFIAEFNSKSEDEKPSSETSTYQQIAKESYDFLMKSVALFESVNDHINLVICHLNLGRFYRLSAFINIFQNYQDLKSLKMQKKCYQKSFDSYRKALDILVERKMKNAELYEIVLWEYSTAVFNLAKEMQEGMSAESIREDAEREVLEMLMKALQLCDIESNNSRQVLYMFRAALIHQRISSLHHQSIRIFCEEHKRKSIVQLCRLHYEKSIKLLETLKEIKDFLKVQLERIALQEFLAEDSTSNQVKIKNYQLAVSYFVESGKMLKALASKKSIIDAEEFLTLLELFEKRLQFVLKSLTKLTSTIKKSNESENYKKMFAVTLRSSQKLKFEELTQHLLKVLESIKNQIESK